MAPMATLCTGCRMSIFGPRGVGLWTRFEARHFSRAVQGEGSRSTKPRGGEGAPYRPHRSNDNYNSYGGGNHTAGYNRTADKKRGPFLRITPFIAAPTIKPEECVSYFEEHVKEWVADIKMKGRLLAFGIPEQDLPALFKAFEAAVKSKSLSTPEGIKLYNLSRFSEPMQHGVNVTMLYSTIFFVWATNPSNHALLLSKGVPQATLEIMHHLVEATDHRFLAEDWTMARKLRRKVIMHVGPTNSGKTYHALRALAAAPTGVYAGPLRLLAHEIWERLNLGQIAPAGSEHPDFKGTDLTPIIDTLAHAKVIKALGNPMYARLCNMVTGEEQKMVSDNSPLMSCTVEMLKVSTIYDVGVVDEIQMISDPQRGSGWTNAVLGLPARELHLCGEETAVPIVEELLRHTGDELEIKRYERLTPLTVEKESLHGDWTKVQKGDCIVAFSRSQIFGIKKEVEQTTGLRCAIIYGRLPPEIRSEQAALFNDPNSGYDVLVGSDAIGMGLNLKIRRLVFHALEKFKSDGGTEKLSVSQIKQIAGRAGRFGLNEGSEPPGGFTTTLEEKDLPALRAALKAPFHTLPFARIGFDESSFSKIIPALPPKSSTSTIIQAHHFISPLPPKIRYQDSDLNSLPSFDFIDKHAGSLTNNERLMHINSPVSWRDPQLLEAVKNFLTQAKTSGRVDLMKMLSTTNWIDSLERLEEAKKRGRNARRSFHLLGGMESFHKTLVLYIWSSFRAPVVYAEYELATRLKERLEVALQWALEGLSEPASTTSTLSSVSSWSKKQAGGRGRRATKVADESQDSTREEEIQGQRQQRHHRPAQRAGSSRLVIPSVSKTDLMILMQKKREEQRAGLDAAVLGGTAAQP